MIDAKYDLALVWDGYSRVFPPFLQFDVWTGILWQVLCPFFQGTFPNTDGLFVNGICVDKHHLKLQGSHQRVLFLET